MRKIIRSIGESVASRASAIFSFKNSKSFRPKPRSFNSFAFRKSFHIFAVAALSLNLVGTGLPYLISQYNDAQALHPRPVASTTQSSGLPAADALNAGGKIAKLPDTTNQQLTDQLAEARKGKQDLRHIQALDEDRTANDTVYQNADGSKSLVHSFQATSYKDDNGKWQDVDTTLVNDQATGKWHTKANAWSVTFGDISNDGVQLNIGEQTFLFSPVSGKSVKPIVTGTAPNQTVTYHNVWQGIDLQYKVTGSELKENIIVKSRAAQTALAFNTTGAGLTANEDGSLSLDGAFAGFSIPATTVTTANNNKPDSKDVSQSLVNGQLTIALDPAWLASRTLDEFPITIDPTVINVGNSFDDFDANTTTGPYCVGASCTGETMGVDNTGDTWRFAFQTSFTVASFSYLVNAKLHLELAVGDSSSRTVKVDHASCQTGINCIDPNGGESTGSLATSSDVDVTGVYRNFINNTTGNFSPWMMVSGDESTSGTFKLLDATKTTLTLTFDTLPSAFITDTGSPADGGASVTTQPTFFTKTSSIVDPDGPGPYQYRFVVGTSKNTPPSNPLGLLPSVTGILADSGRLQINQWTVPDNVLQDGQTYYWQPLVWDFTTGVPDVYGPVYSFKVDLRNGKDATQAFDGVGPVSTDLATGNLTASAKSHSITALGGDMGITLDYNSPQRSRQGLVGQYWNEDPLNPRTIPTSAAPLTRTDPSVSFNWGSASPYTGLINNDNFLVRWTGYFVAPQTGTYQFGATSHDGVRIYVNNTLNLDSWTVDPINAYGTGVALTVGQIIPIKYEYDAWTGNADTQLLVKTTDGSINQNMPSTWLQTGARSIATTHGLVGRYYGFTPAVPWSPPMMPADNGPSLFLARTDPSLSLNWGAGSPVPGGPSDNFIVRWSGWFTAPTDDTYKLGVASDDGARIYLDGNLTTPVVDSWSDHGYGAISYMSTGVSMLHSTPRQITIDYYEHGGASQIGLFMRQNSIVNGTFDMPVPSSALTTKAQVLPDGWNLGIDSDGNLSYDIAYISSGGVTLLDSAGQTHEYKYVNGGFTPPAGEAGHMVRNSDGTVTLQDSDGRNYIFNSDGTIKSVTTSMDDRTPAALQYVYGGSPAHLTQISDAVTQTDPNNPLTASRWAKVIYSGDSRCPIVPTGYLPYANTSGMICAVLTSDGAQPSQVNVANGNVTRFLYLQDTGGHVRLARVEQPGAEMTDYVYYTEDPNNPTSCPGCLYTYRDSLANDAVNAVPQVRAPDGTELTTIAYDTLGKVSSITMPAATAGATRQAHSYGYFPLNTPYTLVHVANATEPNGFTRKVMYDGTYRTTDDINIANLDTKTTWDSAKDLVQSSTDPANLMSTTLYDYADRATDQYGSAPSTWFGSDRKPLPGNEPVSGQPYTSLVPHKSTGYDESIPGLAAAFYDDTTYSNGTGTTAHALFGNPRLHATGVGPANGDVVKSWGASQPITPSQSTYGWGLRLSGYVHFTANGTYNFTVKADDGVRLWVDDTLVLDDWAPANPAYHDRVASAVNNTLGDSWHRIRLDYYNKYNTTTHTLDTDGHLELWMNGSSALGSLLSPGYGLTTSETTFDSSAAVGSNVTKTSYGTNPELGLAQSSTVDPTPGMNLATTNTYETPGSGSFLRQLSKTLPGGATTNYAYYGANQTADNPCTGPTETFNQAGRLHTTTQPDPDGAGSQTGITSDNVYDDQGHVVASRTNTDAWACTTYDARGRITQKVIPADVNGSSRTITYSYAVNSNPLATSESDANSTSTIVTTVDLLGRAVSYQDRNNTSATPTNTTYDNIGRLSTRTGKMGTELFVYDNFNRLTSQKLDGTILATPTYDAFGRLQQVTYPQAGQLKLVISRDNLGREVGNDFTLGNGTTHETDSVTLSQSGSVISGTELGAAKSYTYDAADRLTSASLGTKTYSYSYAAPNPATCNQSSANLNANKDSNRTSQTVNGVATTYCYDNADRLIASSDASLTTPAYDTHGNATTVGATPNANQLTFQYDSSDRTTLVQDIFGTNHVAQYHYDPDDRIFERDENQGTTSLWNSFYGFTSPASNGPDYEMDNHWTVRERYEKLPGGVMLTVRNPTFSSTSNVYSLSNVHGDTMATANGAGTLINTFAYEPFGKTVSATTPDNANGKADFDYLGRYQKQTETWFGNQPEIMGARTYMSVLGRFTQVDPVEGGVENNYVYPPDPVNDKDITGQCPFCLYLIYVVGVAVVTEGSELLEENPASISSAKKYSVYVGRDTKGLARYVGITKRNPVVRWLEHKRSKTARATLEYRQVKSGLNRQTAREIEQQFIDRYGLGRNGGQLYNNINSIRR